MIGYGAIKMVRVLICKLISNNYFFVVACCYNVGTAGNTGKLEGVVGWEKDTYVSADSV